MVINITSANGSEAWRQLAKRYSPRTMGKREHYVRQCVNPTKAKKLVEVTAAIAKWETSLRVLGRSSARAARRRALGRLARAACPPRTMGMPRLTKQHAASITGYTNTTKLFISP